MAQLVVSAEDRALLLPSVVARRLGVSYGKVMEWARRAEDPLPKIDCSSGGKRERRRVIASEIDPWLQREAERTMPGALR